MGRWRVSIPATSNAFVGSQAVAGTRPLSPSYAGLRRRPILWSSVGTRAASTRPIIWRQRGQAMCDSSIAGCPWESRGTSDPSIALSIYTLGADARRASFCRGRCGAISKHRPSPRGRTAWTHGFSRRRRRHGRRCPTSETRHLTVARVGLSRGGMRGSVASCLRVKRDDGLSPASHDRG